ncbi:MAG: fused MFS/spermidine synthase [Rhodospirillales bacterium]|nr:fused MFS/spermidine synthase [Rhodospirillales bacterium]
MALAAVAVFLGAFLLFLVQPLIGRIVVPWFGGGAPVWTASLVFFQVALLAGSAYAAFVGRRLSPRAQAVAHVALVAASLLALPLTPDPGWKPDEGASPVPRLLALMALSVGGPYMLLAAGGPLLQAWLARAGHTPWRLFALSNLASLAALVAYPFVVEPWLTITTQRWLWSGGYAIYAALIAALAWRMSTVPAAAEAPAAAEPTAAPEEPVERGGPALWILLAAVPSALLLAVTEYLTRDVAPMPLLWIPPLALYLATFVIWFDGNLPYHRPSWLAAAALAVVAMAMAMTTPALAFKLVPNLLVFGVGLFLVTLFCHGELVAVRPAPSRLGGYYLCIAVGGAIGGVAVGLAFPVILSNTYDLEIALGAAGVVVAVRAAALWPRWLALGGYAAGVAALAMAGWAGWYRYDASRTEVSVTRNFYGTLHVMEGNKGEREHYVQLAHGGIVHGFQMMAPDRRRTAVGYYRSTSGVGLALRALPDGPRKVGIVGLGTGGIAAHSRAGDVYRFYDIDPGVVAVARKHFTYLSDSPARIDIVLGDARLRLEREAPQAYDLLAVDAFTGDAIPLHLLTLEAIDVYLRHVKPDGVLAIHVSNKFLRLPPVLEIAARARGLRIVLSRDTDDQNAVVSDWVLMARDGAPLGSEALKRSLVEIDARPEWRPWTDDYVDLLRALK